ncbi:MAG: hypothetical protein H5T82_00395 [Demequina sp.]|nr:hypothetical protein [Demequina sp.]
MSAASTQPPSQLPLQQVDPREHDAVRGAHSPMASVHPPLAHAPLQQSGPWSHDSSLFLQTLVGSTHVPDGLQLPEQQSAPNSHVAPKSPQSSAGSVHTSLKQRRLQQSSAERHCPPGRMHSPASSAASPPYAASCGAPSTWLETFELHDPSPPQPTAIAAR